MSTLRRVALVGASGDLGSVVFKRLASSPDFDVTVLRRLGSKSSYPAGTNVVDVDFSSQQSLEQALRGQDAVVSTVGNTGLQDQSALVDAAAATGVKRFIPSGFGSDLENAKAQQLPVFGPKIKVDNHLKELCKTSDMTYTTVSTMAFLDWGLQKGFFINLADSKPFIYDGGDLPFSATTLATIADTVAAILKHPDETKNRCVYVQDLVTTQNRILELAKQVAPERPWEPIPVSIDDMVAKSDKQLAEGKIDHTTFISYLLRSLYTPGYGGKMEKTDNELLGIKEKDESVIVDILKSLLK